MKISTIIAIITIGNNLARHLLSEDARRKMRADRQYAPIAGAHRRSKMLADRRRRLRRLRARAAEIPPGSRLLCQRSRSLLVVFRNDAKQHKRAIRSSVAGEWAPSYFRVPSWTSAWRKCWRNHFASDWSWIFCFLIDLRRRLSPSFGMLQESIPSRCYPCNHVDYNSDTGPVLPDWDRDGASARTNGSVVGSVQWSRGWSVLLMTCAHVLSRARSRPYSFFPIQ